MGDLALKFSDSKCLTLVPQQTFFPCNEHFMRELLGPTLELRFVTGGYLSLSPLNNLSLQMGSCRIVRHLLNYASVCGSGQALHLLHTHQQHLINKESFNTKSLLRKTNPLLQIERLYKQSNSHEPVATTADGTRRQDPSWKSPGPK